jgi:hypothetical protein
MKGFFSQTKDKHLIFQMDYKDRSTGLNSKLNAIVDHFYLLFKDGREEDQKDIPDKTRSTELPKHSPETGREPDEMPHCPEVELPKEEEDVPFWFGEVSKDFSWKNI